MVKKMTGFWSKSIQKRWSILEHMDKPESSIGQLGKSIHEVYNLDSAWRWSLQIE